MSTEHGRVLAVNRVRLGSELVGAHAADASSLLVEDGADFDEDGGSLLVGAQVVTYSAATHIEADDTASLTLTATLTAAGSDGDPVLLYDASRAAIASEVYAECEIDGEAGGDTIRALVAHHLLDSLPEGIRGLVGESVLMAEDGDDWRVIDVLGLDGEASGPKWEDNDPHTLTAGEVTAGTFTHTLLHSRIVDHHEFLAMVNGVALGPDRFTLDADEGVVTVTLGGWETVADNLRFHYGYLKGPVSVLSGLVLRGSTLFRNAGAFTSAALPAGSQVGDLVVMTGNAGNMGGRDAPLPLGSVTDPRITGGVEHISGSDFWGTLTDLTALQVSVSSEGELLVAVFYDLGGEKPVEVAPGWTSVTKSVDTANETDPITVPSHDTNGVVLLITEDIGISNAAPGMTGYSSAQVGDETLIQYWSGPPAPSPGSTWTETSSYQRYDRTLTVLPVKIAGS